ncbi:MAG: ATP-dependent DNA helicase RecG [Oscillospiraceae bacterium]|nr:ATP-dependent DNA helicase RecG [Oscillospiraceae bacterium]
MPKENIGSPWLSPVTVLKNVGPKRAALYEKLGIRTVEDLLRHYPRGYVDYASSRPVSEWMDGETAVIEAKILRRHPPAPIRKGLTVYKLTATDGLEQLTVTIFNNEFAYYALKAGETYVFRGKFSRMGSQKQLTMLSYVTIDEADVQRPVYPMTEGLAPGMILHNMEEAAERFLPLMPDPMPPEILREKGLMGLEEAIRAIHFPEDEMQLNAAKRRLSYEELFTISAALMLLRGRERLTTGVLIEDADMAPFYGSLPFSPTGAQKRVIGEILKDMAAGTPMNRLLQGDVGSGKTMVAAAACFAAWQKGYQSALMAPTEILAAQHAVTLKKFLEPLGLRVALLTGSLTQKQKNDLRAKIAAGEVDLVAGTHALVQDATVFHDLGLVITDEQHRFGVAQRQKLGQKGSAPHVLVMSATPIPRTLALIAYGDLDLSIIDELPKGRQPIETFAVHSDKRNRALGYIRDHLERGEQGYVVCPLIEESDSGLMAAERYASALQRVMIPHEVGLLHGRMKPAEKDAVMAEFSSGKIALLVATTVVEVGVDVPNATIMMIENAERFGLSQLHQLRGRVGRGSKKSTCILVSDNEGEDNRRRLSVMKQTCDGFVIAKEDLKLRGAGDFFGQRQSGVPSLAMGDLLEDTGLFAEAQADARALLAADPDLSEEGHVLFGEKIRGLFADREGTMN